MSPLHCAKYSATPDSLYHQIYRGFLLCDNDGKYSVIVPQQLYQPPKIFQVPNSTLGKLSTISNVRKLTVIQLNIKSKM